MARSYEAWDNERLDELVADKKIHRIGNVEAWNVKVTMKCDVCGHEWETTPYNIKQGSGCPECSRRSKAGTKKKAKYTMREVKAMFDEVNIDVLTEKYQNSQAPLLLKCRNCNHTFNRTLMSFLRGFKKCPNCRENIND